MSNTTERLLDNFRAISGRPSRSLSDAQRALEPLTDSFASTGSSGTAAASSSGQNVYGGVTTESSSGGGVGSTIESVATSILTGGFGIVSLISGLAGLFGGGKAPQPLQKFEMPAPISFTSADVGGQLQAADYDQLGMPRLYDTSTSGGAATPASGGSANPASGGTPAGQSLDGGQQGHQITVNVQAMDAQSFMDYSSQIATAVRSAMLNMSSINDVVNSL